MKKSKFILLALILFTVIILFSGCPLLDLLLPEKAETQHEVRLNWTRYGYTLLNVKIDNVYYGDLSYYDYTDYKEIEPGYYNITAGAYDTDIGLLDLDDDKKEHSWTIDIGWNDYYEEYTFDLQEDY